MSFSLLLNPTDDSSPPLDHQNPHPRPESRRRGESGRIPISSLLTRDSDDDIRPRHHDNDIHYHHAHHHMRNHVPSQSDGSLSRQSSMHTDRRPTTPRTPLPPFSSLNQSFHEGVPPVRDAERRGFRHSGRPVQATGASRYREEAMPYGYGNNSASMAHRASASASASHRAVGSSSGSSSASGAIGKTLTRTHSVPHLSEMQQHQPYSAEMTPPGSAVSHSSSKSPGPPSPSSAASSGKLVSPNAPRRRWKPWEDQLLNRLVKEQGAQKWNTIAEGFPGRNGRQVRLRWMNHLQPSLDKRPWRPDEDEILLAAHEELGNKWALIAMRLHGRTDNSVKNRYKSIARRAARASQVRFN